MDSFRSRHLADGQCHLLDDMFSKLLQAALGVLALTVLVYKRHVDPKPRPWIIWFLDSAKQATSSLVAHFSGMAIAYLIAGFTEDGNECGWYLVAYCVDTSLGVFLSLKLLGLTSKAAGALGWTSLQTTGLYYAYAEVDGLPAHGAEGAGPEPTVMYGVWAKQAMQWCVCTFLARIVCGIFDYILRHPLGVLVQLVASPFRGRPHLFLVFVMAACPLGLNAVQYWVQDSFLRYRDASGGSGSGDADGGMEDHRGGAARRMEARRPNSGLASYQSSEERGSPYDPPVPPLMREHQRGGGSPPDGA
jgi:hypothetical protein